MIKNIRLGTLVLSLFAMTATSVVLPITQSTNTYEQMLKSSLDSFLNSPLPNSSTWRTMVQNKINELKSIDPIAAASYQIKYNNALKMPSRTMHVQ